MNSSQKFCPFSKWNHLCGSNVWAFLGTRSSLIHPSSNCTSLDLHKTQTRLYSRQPLWPLVEFPYTTPLSYNAVCLRIPPSISSQKKFKFMYMRRSCRIIGTCNGLTCLVNSPREVNSRRETEFYLWNPATKWFSKKLVSFHHGLNSLFKFSLGYDNLTNKYKEVAFRPHEVKVLTFGDNVWKNIQNFPRYPSEYLRDHVNVGVYLNNSLNWFLLRDIHHYYRYHCTNLSVQQFMIISLDLEVQTYRHFRFPRGFDQVPVVALIGCGLRECICFSYYWSGYNFVIWEKKEFEVEESWTKLLKFDYTL